MTADDARLASLVGRLDLDAKVRLLTGAAMFTLHGEESIGLAPLAFSDGPTGVRGLGFTGGPKTCLLPNATSLAASWSTDTAREVGALLAEEAERQHIHVVLGPTINLHRSPLGGRLFEAYSEDPLLTGRFAAAYVEGLQAQGVGACLKHLVANEAETDRHTVDSRVDARTMRELYLLPFEIAVSDADPWSVMAAYNDVNGVPATEQDEINNGVLKGEWGWTGLLMSDWFATKSAGPAANGGLDLVMPGPGGPWGGALVAAVRAGEVAEAVVDDHVVRLLRLASRVGALGQQRQWPTDVPAPGGAARREQLTRLAAQGMVVLKNEGALPLARDARTAVIGRHAIETTCMGGGSASVRAPHQISVAEGLAARLDSVEVVDGVAVRALPRAARPAYVSDPATGAPGVRARLLGASGDVVQDTVAEESVVLVGLPDAELAEPPARAVLSAVVPAGAMRIGVLGVGRWTLRAGPFERQVEVTAQTDDLAEAILFPPGWQTDLVLAEPTEVVAEVAVTVQGALGIVAEPTPPADDAALDAAVKAALAAEAAVVVVGFTEEQETEGLDKTTLALPGRQDELVAAVAAVARRTVVVVNAATPVLMPWLSSVDAVLWAGIPGQEAGHAVAAALLGEIEPAGRLVTSFPAADGASPAWGVAPTDGTLPYQEGVFVGYRGFAAGLVPPPAFWFGHGLGYGSWEYAGGQATGTTVTVEVTNTSAFRSREIVQVYYDPEQEAHPVRLVGWAAASVDPGSTATVSVECDERMWRTWDTATSSWRRLAGGTLLVARGLGDVRLRLPAQGTG